MHICASDIATKTIAISNSINTHTHTYVCIFANILSRNCIRARPLQFRRVRSLLSRAFAIIFVSDFSFFVFISDFVYVNVGRIREVRIRSFSWRIFRSFPFVVAAGARGRCALRTMDAYYAFLLIFLVFDWRFGMWLFDYLDFREFLLSLSKMLKGWFRNGLVFRM